jgi:tRNA pseudouridine13 synthase
MPESYPPGVPRAHGLALACAQMKLIPEDFQVDERLGFEPEGDGSHAWLRIRKTGQNTQWVASELAKASDNREVDIGFAGMKDRHAVTTQWFSVDLKGRPMPDWSDTFGEDTQVLEVTRHPRKLRRGQLSGNDFRINLRITDGLSQDGASQTAPSAENLDARIGAIRATGVPNYFGPQRFGRDGQNLAAAARMFSGGRAPRGRHQRGIYLSAARSQLFNDVLAARVRDNTWARITPGEAVLASDTARAFPHHRSREAATQTLENALRAQRIHPTGPLWGRGESVALGHALALERAIVQEHEAFALGLERAGLAQERRALRLSVDNLMVDRADTCLVVAFGLPRGCFATSVVRELVHTRDATSGLVD